MVASIIILSIREIIMINLDDFSSFYVANWKLNGDFEFIDNFLKDLKTPKDKKKCVVICPTSIHLDYLSKKAVDVFIGAQNISSHYEGSYTGEISAKALKELQISFCIIGHSERRQYYKEINQEINLKAATLVKNQITPILCIGETLEEKKNGLTKEILKKQLLESINSSCNKKNTIIAYEPVWAIGTGLTPDLKEIDEVHEFIRSCDSSFVNFSILYGGSVKSNNSKEIISLPNVNGALIGGASLKSGEFSEIIKD